ncbi:CDP-diacylglycerol diphosphatase [Enterobacteriaceae bacterium H20N1]|uniref:CDP-diacylglycerol pyrophosphatase n=1 Tax=Dryocola boscaweniae TaxID=2925397 RepID=A0A9X2W6C0_9ENTR|nr:CDP-diacylglycerol diphosphatase [Dryocola boscaweniae]MCT4701910.1 CDP-diacylglycerol diphosphatase [Dryocola boscaweniae]MCT4719078.1 CDP-diacylglycerol diphosphatase [Dryocola boscaweniae]
MKKALRIIFFLLIVLVVAAAVWLLYIRANSDALWKIVSEQCVPNQQQRHDPAPCLAVDPVKHFVVFKDAKGPLHTLAMPTEKITGIESPAIQKPDAPNYFYYAWQERGRLKQMADKPVNDRYLALAINSWYGRSQNQLHIHLACLRPDVYQALNQHEGQISNSWQPFGEKLKGHDYLAMKIPANTFEQQSPFALLNAYVKQRGDDIAKYGLAVTMTEQGEFMLLANRLKVTDLNLGTAGEILDYGCALQK